jgi:hypothetical protein
METDLTDLGIVLSGGNIATVGTDIDNIDISVLDGSSRCPDDYQVSQTDWDAATNIFTKNMQ